MAAIALLLLVLATAACSSATSPRTSSTSSPTSVKGHSLGRLTCESDEYEISMADFSADAVGFDTVAEAVAAFQAGDDWQLRADWHPLIHSETDTTQFINERGWVYLDVDLTRLNDTWLVSGFETCIPVTP